MYDDDPERKEDVLMAFAIRIYLSESYISQMHEILQRIVPEEEQDILKDLRERWSEYALTVNGAFYAEDSDALKEMLLKLMERYEVWENERHLFQMHKYWNNDDGGEGNDDDDDDDGGVPVG